MNHYIKIFNNIFSSHTSIEDSEITYNSQNEEDITNNKDEEIDLEQMNESKTINALDQINLDYEEIKQISFNRNNSLVDTPHNSFENESIKDENNLWNSNQSSMDTVKEAKTKNDQNLFNENNSENSEETENIDTDTESSNTVLNANEEDLKKENFNKISLQPIVVNYLFNEESKNVLKSDKIKPEFEEFNENFQKELDERNNNDEINSGKKNEINPELEKFNENLQKGLDEQNNNINSKELEKSNKTVQNNLNIVFDNKSLTKDEITSELNKLNPEMKDNNINENAKIESNFEENNLNNSFDSSILIDTSEAPNLNETFGNFLLKNEFIKETPRKTFIKIRSPIFNMKSEEDENWQSLDEKMIHRMLHQITEDTQISDYYTNAIEVVFIYNFKYLVHLDVRQN